METIEVVQS